MCSNRQSQDKKDETSLAHLHLGLIAYQLVNTIRYQLKLKSLSDAKESPTQEEETDNVIRYDWREIVRIMNTQKTVTTLAQNNREEIIIIRKCSEPNQKVKQIYDKLAYRYYPLGLSSFLQQNTLARREKRGRFFAKPVGLELYSP